MKKHKRYKIKEIISVAPVPVDLNGREQKIKIIKVNPLTLHDARKRPYTKKTYILRMNVLVERK